MTWAPLKQSSRKLEAQLSSLGRQESSFSKTPLSKHNDNHLIIASWDFSNDSPQLLKTPLYLVEFKQSLFLTA